MSEGVSGLDLNIIGLQGQAYKLLADCALSPEEIESFTQSLANVIVLGLNITTKERGLTEDQAMALLILTVIKATEISGT